MKAKLKLVLKKKAKTYCQPPTASPKINIPLSSKIREKKLYPNLLRIYQINNGFDSALSHIFLLVKLIYMEKSFRNFISPAAHVEPRLLTFHHTDGTNMEKVR